MKYFSALIAFVIIFASLSVAHADIAFPPRPPSKAESQFVTISTDDQNNLYLQFNFPAACNYKYRLLDKRTEKEMLSGEGSYKTSDSIKDVVDLSERLSRGKNYFLLNIRLSDIREETPFGVKARNSECAIKKIIVIRTVFDKIYDFEIYDDTN